MEERSEKGKNKCPCHKQTVVPTTKKKKEIDRLKTNQQNEKEREREA